MASTYDLVNYDSDEEREKHPNVPFANPKSAALFMAGLLEGARFIYGLMGELAVAFLRSTRVSWGVDMALAPRKWRDIWKIMEAGPGYAVP
ncbi:uncharacterized protein AKAW2_60931S [Aspergillus luchuensis]|uniref:Similar to An12g05540 n=1 Tax=Aspergillus kawachii TaxID=1069201 RepID=A0A146FYQ3_ASPKA|nr:uncharacterized protein AKAW2_60931S [Aspergillus luchuensis]BCS02667.1 hypothetical protein AKAW2_60931S [Aspergillus luchuensis]GAT30159.1 similar to An12g05540 [Aspergillus luchuensis]